VTAAAQAAADLRPTLKVGTASAVRGQKDTGVIAVPAGVDPATNIAVAVVHGARPGPVLAVVSGLHGTEYSSTWRHSSRRSRTSTRSTAGA